MKLADWVDQRTGFRKITRRALYENVPGGSRWRYVWGSVLGFALLVQLITGVGLWLCYAPSSHTAWESVFYVQNNMWGGWLLRGLHHYMAQAVVVLLVLHLMQVVIDGAYKAPREVNFWFGLLLLLLVLALALTGYLLPWDQMGFWSTKVATNIAAITPGIGLALQKILVGGPDYGNATLTRFFALHAGILPGTIIVLIVLHIYLFRRHGYTVKKPLRRRDAAYWPDQALKDIVACLAMMAAVLFIIIRHHGAALGPPADATNNYSAARPEWYFLFLYQFLKQFPGGTEAIGALWIPGFLILLIALMPFIGQWKLGHGFNVALILGLVAGAGFLTWRAVVEDRNKPDFIAATHNEEVTAARITMLAESPEGIPVGGALSLLQKDPLTQGPRLFAKYCASCHRFDGADGAGRTVRDKESASDLKGFASTAWLAGLLNPTEVDSVRYFGGTALKNGRMVKFVHTKVAAFSPEQKADLTKVIDALAGEARGVIGTTNTSRPFFDDLRCSECHQLHNTDADATAPDLTGYGSRQWLIDFIGNPRQDKFYGERDDRMPSFAREKILDDDSIALLADWLRGSWYGSTAAR